MTARLDEADPQVLVGFAGDAARAADRLQGARSRLTGATVSPEADRFGLLTDLLRQEADARRQVVAAVATLTRSCDDLAGSARDFAEAFRVAMEVR